MEIEDRKKCSTCGRAKTLGQFKESSRSGDGYTSSCNNCRNGRNKGRVSKQRKKQLDGFNRPIPKGEFVNWNNDGIYC